MQEKTVISMGNNFSLKGIESSLKKNAGTLGMLYGAAGTIANRGKTWYGTDDTLKALIKVIQLAIDKTMSGEITTIDSVFKYLTSENVAGPYLKTGIMLYLGGLVSKGFPLIGKWSQAMEKAGFAAIKGAGLGAVISAQAFAHSPSPDMPSGGGGGIVFY